MSGSSSDGTWRLITSVLEGQRTSRDDVNAALTAVGVARADLDRIEHQLIALARSSGSSWQEIATSLGVHSRQAAEQRYLRLEANAEADLGAVRRRLATRRELDAQAGVNAARLRAVIGGLIDELQRTVRGAGSRGAADRSRHADVRDAVDPSKHANVRGGADCSRRADAGGAADSSRHAGAGDAADGSRHANARGAVDRSERADARGVADNSRHAEARDAVALLALATLRIAVESEAGPMCDLAVLAVSDLDGLPPDLQPSGWDAAIGAVRLALRSILGGSAVPHD